MPRPTDRRIRVSVPLTTIAAATLTIVSMVAAVGRRDRFPLHTLSALGMGAIMFGVLFIPDFSHLVASSLTVVLMLLVLAGIVGIRTRIRQPLDYGLRTTMAIPVVDTGFMSAAVLLMPVHGIVQQLASAPQAAGILGHGSPVAMSGGVMTWFVLLAWASCAAVLIVPAIRHSSRGGFSHIVCSGGMIAAMAAMAI